MKQRPNFAAAHEALARAYISKHDYQNAAAELRRAIALRPQDDGAYYDLGLVYMELKQPKQAQDTFTQLLKINANSADGHTGLGAAFSDQHQDAEALAEYQRAAAIDSNYQGINYNIGLGAGAAQAI